MNNLRLHLFLGRLSVAFVFVVFGIWEIIQPAYWSGFVPAFASNFVSTSTLLTIHGVVLIVLGLALLVGKYLRIVATLSSLVLLSIVIAVLQSGWSDIAVRDIAILIFTTSLIFVPRE